MATTAFGTGGPSATVIVATFNQPRPLELLLTALAAQTRCEFDVIVADDGSDPPAGELVDRLRGDLPFPIDTVWQENAGFRKTRALNLAASRTAADLLLFLDGDCIPFRNWVETYRQAALPGEFLVGGYLPLDARASREITPQQVRAGVHESALTCLYRRATVSRHLSNRFQRGRRQTRPRIRGGNFAVTSNLYRRVNGFDETFCGYGKEDSDLRNRMRNAGALGICLWHRAFVVHLARSGPRSQLRNPSPGKIYAEGRRRVEARLGLDAHAREAAARSRRSSSQAP